MFVRTLCFHVYRLHVLMQCVQVLILFEFFSICHVTVLLGKSDPSWWLELYFSLTCISPKVTGTAQMQEETFVKIFVKSLRCYWAKPYSFLSCRISPYLWTHYLSTSNLQLSIIKCSHFLARNWSSWHYVHAVQHPAHRLILNGPWAR